ncbi:putative alanine transaminase [Candidatus Kuenenia stuttgartiensis]|jgi:aspartate/methionine/tyrosine aminotransferase|uniref:alanine transaminase n=1 Tax=Kuenenia stuttgartiensis TaxID=174633 RepID=A0A2C9CEX5_KUEST|nr:MULTISPECIES: pyridoxal phosphate-dependent aminotransferase [Kuenenia]MBE7546514.1 pyridoxal phosphate-dependent aminotransferase [Planctomycetia bacterium]MBZ0191998.1 pyridoxal phosphate-dependent aminotransferase [Candidatus Kuenenia stuttgartiensis]MCF6151477.1 pyridoxal phosphate-dependent aminotransferase [Candidatus Kuenenia stuttgartiensis]MCL4726934.1 pyridoxal phosphate-dependent aminotransferase [Candidatus Kuenenia stuttgartiensis]MCZ7621855.1 pyridoxal phosphate-dependent amin
MRRGIEHEGWRHLTYEIRAIVAVANELKKLGVEITWENIGDPVQKGEKIPQWIKDIVIQLVSEDKTYGYVATQGVPETRKFLADLVNKRGGYQISPDDIIFFNGLGDAVSTIFSLLKREARVIGPSPAYSTHSSAEAAHSGYDHLTYDLDPENNWLPDLNDIENKIKYNDSIAGMLIINPDNPTGSVYPRSFLEKIVEIAKRYELFLICDEIYANIVYNGAETANLSEIIGGVPGMAMRGISKEFPWPGSRCGWIEVFNQESNPEFKNYIKSLINAKMLEVCSTSLPQYAIPLIMGNPNYPAHLKMRREKYEYRAYEACEIFSKVDGIRVVKPQGAFYMSIVFKDGVLNAQQTLPIENIAVKKYILDKVSGVEVDKRFVYYLLGATGICVVPLTGFCCTRKGFRITLLEADDEKRKWTWNTIAENINKYVTPCN